MQSAPMDLTASNPEAFLQVLQSVCIDLNQTITFKVSAQQLALSTFTGDKQLFSKASFYLNEGSTQTQFQQSQNQGRHRGCMFNVSVSGQFLPQFSVNAKQLSQLTTHMLKTIRQTLKIQQVPPTFVMSLPSESDEVLRFGLSAHIVIGGQANTLKSSFQCDLQQTVELAEVKFGFSQQPVALSIKLGYFSNLIEQALQSKPSQLKLSFKTQVLETTVKQYLVTVESEQENGVRATAALPSSYVRDAEWLDQAWSCSDSSIELQSSVTKILNESLKRLKGADVVLVVVTTTGELQAKCPLGFGEVAVGSIYWVIAPLVETDEDKPNEDRASDDL